MSKVQLVPLAVTDLSMKYARRIDERRIVHYRVSAISHISGMGGDAFGAVSEYIRQFEGLEVELVQNANQAKKSGNEMDVEDMTHKVLSGMSSVRKALQKRNISSTFYQYTEPMYFADRENEPTSYIDGQGQVHQSKKTPKWKIAITRAAYAVGLQNFLPSSIHCEIRRVIHVSYLTYCYEETDEAKAIAAMREDLKALHDRGLIMGSLTMPSAITMADTIGAGVLRKVLFCFVVVNIPKLLRQVRKNPLEVSRKPLSEFLGIKGESFEGELGHNITPGKYEIEIVDVNPHTLLTSDRIHEAVYLNYLQNVPHVNEAALRQHDYLKIHDIQSSSSHIDDRHIQVDVKFFKKSDK